MREMNLSEYKTCLLSIMDCVHNFCESNGLKYYLFYGTLIGAARHKGFIPWDDDIDIGMPRKDYDLLCKNFNKNSDGLYKLVSIDSTPGYYLPFAKVIDTRTLLRENVSNPVNLGAYVDVFPLDSCPGDLAGSESFLNSCGTYRNRLAAKNIVLFKRRKIYKYPIIVAAKLSVLPFSAQQLATDIDARARKYQDETKSAYVGEVVLGTYGVRGIFDRAWFGEGLLHEFEGRRYRVPSEYGKILTKLYGNYLELPPIESQTSHHDFSVWAVEGSNRA